MQPDQSHGREGDASETSNSLVDHVEWLRRVARALIADPEERDEAVQETCLATLKQRPEESNGLRGWLKCVLVRRAGRQRELRRLQERWESFAASSEAMPSAHDISERLALQRELAQALADLPEPQRVAVWMRYWENAPPREIARGLGVPVETVRTRLKRALATLRGMLERSHGMDWKAAVAPLAGAPVAGAPSVLGTSAAAGVILGVGGMALKTKVWIAGSIVFASLAIGTWQTARWWLAPSMDFAALVDPPAAPIPPRAHDSAPQQLASREVTATDRIGQGVQRHTTTAEATGTNDDVLIEIVDAQGRVVLDYGVRLYARSTNAEEAGPRRLNRYERDKRSTDPNIRIPRASIERTLTKSNPARSSNGQIYSVYVAIDAPCVDCTEYAFAHGAIPSERIRLRIAPCGSVQVTAMGEAEVPMERSLNVVIRAAPSGTKPSDNRAFGELWGQSGETNGGSHIFAHVRTPSMIEIQVTDPSGILDDQVVRLEGPTQPDEVKHVTVRMTDEAPQITGRLLNESGELLRARRFHLEAKRRGSSHSVAYQTDEEGRFRVGWTASRRSKEAVDALEFRTDGENPIRELKIESPSIPTIGTLDLGDLVLAAPDPGPIIVAGTVVDGEGIPLSGAMLELREVWPDTAEGPRETSRRLFASFALSDTSGRFVVHSNERITTLRIEPRLQGYYAASPLVVEAGRSDLRFEMLRGGSLKGAVLVDDVRMFGSMRITPHGDRSFSDAGKMSESGEFALGGMKPGRYRLDVELDGYVVASCEEVELVGGLERRDARLDPLDLRGVLRRWIVRILDARREPLGGRRCAIAIQGVSSGCMFKASDQEGRLEIWIPREIESIRFFGSASAAKEVVWSEDEQALVLDDAPTFRFRVSGIPKVPTRFEVRVGLRAPRGGSGDPNLLASSVAFRERAVSNGDIVEQVVAWPGQYEHHWLLRSKSTDQFTTIAIVPCDVPSEPAVEEMEISPPADALEKAVAEMQRREGR